MMSAGLKVLCFATQGSGSTDEERIAYLLEPLSPTLVGIERDHKGQIPARVLRAARRERPDAIVMEGTGLAGGAAVLTARLGLGIPFIVSSGDAVAPFLRALHPWTALFAGPYERVLCALCDGYIGWTPYLAGRALTLGAPRAMSAPHFARALDRGDERDAVRRRLGIGTETIVLGIVGSILTEPRSGYCYGLDLVTAIRRAQRSDVCVLVVGDGDGLPRLRELAGDDLDGRVLLPGRCSPDEVAGYLRAMDVGVLSQSVDAVGSFRYTTKLPEYLGAGLPVVSLETPAAYDLDTGWLWRLPGRAPWDETYIAALTRFIETIDRGQVAGRAARIPTGDPTFDGARQQLAVSRFVADAVAASRDS
jgi:glycosyltransferase involved in cell wall biosynthesis